MSEQLWWIVPKEVSFENLMVKNSKTEYIVEPQDDRTFYKGLPINYVILAKDFKSEEEAIQYLLDSKKDDFMFTKAKEEISNLILNLGKIDVLLDKQQKITQEDIDECFLSFNNSLKNGYLKEVIER